MASTTASTSAAIVTVMQASSYRVKFKRQEFLELVELASPSIIFRRGSNHFFAFEGFVAYCQQCEDDDFPNQKVIQAIELSNAVWST